MADLVEAGVNGVGGHVGGREDGGALRAGGAEHELGVQDFPQRAREDGVGLGGRVDAVEENKTIRVAGIAASGEDIDDAMGRVGEAERRGIPHDNVQERLQVDDGDVGPGEAGTGKVGTDGDIERERAGRRERSRRCARAGREARGLRDIGQVDDEEIPGTGRCERLHRARDRGGGGAGGGGHAGIILRGGIGDGVEDVVGTGQHDEEVVGPGRDGAALEQPELHGQRSRDRCRADGGSAAKGEVKIGLHRPGRRHGVLQTGDEELGVNLTVGETTGEIRRGRIGTAGGGEEIAGVREAVAENEAAGESAGRRLGMHEGGQSTGEGQHGEDSQTGGVHR